MRSFWPCEIVGATASDANPSMALLETCDEDEDEGSPEETVCVTPGSCVPIGNWDAIDEIAFGESCDHVYCCVHEGDDAFPALNWAMVNPNWEDAIVKKAHSSERNDGAKHGS